MQISSRQTIAPRLWLWLPVLSLTWLTACVTDSDIKARSAGAEPSVRPGVNAEYLAPNINVGQWVERLEREGREIYDKRKEIVQAVKLTRGQAVADVGAGTGLFTPMLAEAVGNSGAVYAVDIVPAFLTRIDERVKAAGIQNVRTVLCSDHSVMLPTNSVDVAFICDTYHHFEYPKSTLISLHRALRPGGEIFLVDFKRVPGVSSDWIMGHVRAGQEVFTAEIEAAGFRKEEEIPLLKENYVLRFRKVAR